MATTTAADTPLRAARSAPSASILQLWCLTNPDIVGGSRHHNCKIDAEGAAARGAEAYACAASSDA
ncbi:hypothetical protein GCM10007977_053510 [Dactylosporangium sucinum]|uniref:Uncharacterized protein n=1 Tax=Dactylosporangium sucinum TaxID=1424081 RepID=A0A917TZJ0_9ACTN|nr:hypothetical protein GCM10007977_053510 [Dactylosporangium sucinum]